MSIKEFFQKAWIVIKRFWYVPVIGVLAIIGLVLFKEKNIFMDLLKGTFKQYNEDIEKVNEIHRKELEQRELAQRQFEERRTQIEQQFQEQNRQLSEDHKKQIDKIIKETNNNPDELARRISEQYGFEVVLPIEERNKVE